MAMGTIFAPTYTTLRIGYFEVYLFDICEVKWGIEFKSFVTENWSRFIDYCETLLDREKVQSQEVLDIIDSIKKSIPFIIKYW